MEYDEREYRSPAAVQLHSNPSLFLQDPLEKQTIFIQSTQTDYGHTTPLKHPSFAYAEFDHLLIIASPSHEDHVPFKKIKGSITPQKDFINPKQLAAEQIDKQSLLFLRFRYFCIVHSSRALWGRL